MNGFPRERAPAPRAQARQATAGDPDWWEIADAAWLTATRLAAGAEPGDDRPARHQRETGQPRPAPAAPVPSADAPSPPLPSPVPPPAGPLGDPAHGPPSPAPDPVPGAATPAAAPVRATEVFGVPPHAPAAPVRLAKALHGLRRRVPSRSRAVLDEERTARHGITDDLWIPYLRPAGETALDLVVLADDGPTMRIWADAVASLATEAERSGAFRDVRVVRLALPRDGEATLRWPGGRDGDPAELIDARGTRVHLVVTDGLGHGWASPTADALLERLTAGGPTALVHLLPTYLWHRTALNPFRAELAAGGFAAPNGRVGHGPPPAGADPLRPPPTPPGDPVPVPVLSLKPEPFAAWAAVVAGESGVRRALPFVLAGTLAQGTPTPGLRAPRATNQRAAAAAVARFASLASPTARRLASQLAAVPFEFDLIEELCQRAFPEARPVHIAEIMMGGLLDWSRTRHGGAPDFAPGIREALLATGSRTQLARTVSLFAELSGGRGRGASLKAALKDPEGAALPELTEENRGWLPIEIAVLKALSGPYARRAARVAGLPDGPTRREGPAPYGNGASNPGITPSRRPGSHHGGGVPTPSPDTPETSARKADQDMAPNTSATRYPRIGQPRIMGNVPPKNPNFTGREDLLSAVERQLRNEETAAVLPHALHGMGGVGKSQIAIEYVYRHSHEYNVIWWIPAEQDSLILGAVADLARALNLDVGPQANTAVPAVREALRSGKPHDNWLLIFDNAEDIDTVRGYFPTGGPGKIIVTSRNRDWERIANPLTVNVFERHESVSLLQRRSRDLSTEDADRLAHALGDLPLAIEQAGAWHAATGMPVAEYLTLLNERRPGILELDPSPDYPVSVAAAWNISLDRLSQTNPAARQLLEVCACMAPEPIPLNMLRGTRNVEISPELDVILRDPVLVARATRDLNKLSLIKLDHKSGTLQLHRLMQTVLLAGLSPEETRRRTTAAQVLLAAAKPGDPQSTDQWPAYQALLPHVIASGAVRSSDPWVRQLVDGSVRYLYFWGAHDASAEMAREAWTAWQAVSGEENLATIQMSRWLAFLLRLLGQADEAYALNSRALEVCRQADVPDEELLNTMAQMAGALRFRGAFDEALRLDAEAYDRARDLFGPEDPATLTAAHSLGVSLRLVGDFTAARELDEETVKQWELLYGPANGQTLNTMNGLAIDIREAGDYTTAREMQEETYRVYRNVYGEDNAGTILAARNLAVCRRRDGLYADASALIEETLERFVSRYGAEYPEVMNTAMNASVDRRLRGDLAGAHELGDLVISRYRGTLGERHAYTLSAMVNHAATLRAQGDLDGADRLHGEAGRLFTETLGDRHVSTLLAAIGQGNNHYARLEFARALAVDEPTLTALEEVSGPDHPLAHLSRANLALDLRGLGRIEEADALNARAVDGLSATLSPDHPWLIAARLHQRIECDIATMPL